MTEEEKRVFDEAVRFREHAYVPASGFKVGAAVLAEDGSIYGGCNIENSCWSLTMCAERTAIFSAIAKGARKLVVLAIVADTEGPAMPCGACRQVIAEFGVEKVIAGNIKGEIFETTAEELLPGAFSFSMQEREDA